APGPRHPVSAPKSPPPEILRHKSTPSPAVWFSPKPPASTHSGISNLHWAPHRETPCLHKSAPACTALQTQLLCSRPSRGSLAAALSIAAPRPAEPQTVCP